MASSSAKQAGPPMEGMGQDSTDIKEVVPLSWMFWRKRRYIVVLLAFLGFFNLYALRVNLSVAIVAMTENRTVTDESGKESWKQDFAWDSKEKGLILSSFFYGYITTQFIGGFIGGKVGGNIVFGIGIGASAALTLLTPVAAKHSLEMLVAVRVLEGFFQGVTFPSIHAVWSRWSPPLERSRMASIAFAGNYAGTVVAMPSSGLLASAFGWESIFYVFGCSGVVWYAIWVICVRSGPERDRFCSKDERDYIHRKIGFSGKTMKIPWKGIFTSPAVYAIYASHFASNWGFYTLLTQLPSFLRGKLDISILWLRTTYLVLDIIALLTPEILCRRYIALVHPSVMFRATSIWTIQNTNTLNFNLDKTGFVSALPYLAMGILLGISGYLADWLQVKKILTTTQVRRYFNCASFLAQTLFMMLTAYILDSTWTVVCLTLAVGLGAFAWSGFAVNHLDVAPQFASVLMGIGNTFATVPGIVSPLLTGYLVTHKTSQEWKMVFYIASGIYVVGCVIYWFWASGEVQPWAKVEFKPREQPT